MTKAPKHTAYFHLPGLFEFYDLYCIFLKLYKERREYFYEDRVIASLYGAPADCLWGGGRVGFGEAAPEKVRALTDACGISARLTFSNSLLEKENLSDRRCHALCRLFSQSPVPSGVIVHSDLLLQELRQRYPSMYFVSSTTKVLTDFQDCVHEIDRPEFAYVVPDFRLNKALDRWQTLTQAQRNKVEFLINECCEVRCAERKACYETVSRKSLGEPAEHLCPYTAAGGYRFSRAMTSPAFISNEDIRNIYLPLGFDQFKIEGRGLGSAVVLEMLLYYLVRPECILTVREEIYLDSMLDLF